MGCYVLLLMVLVFLRWWYIRQNRLHEKQLAEEQAVADVNLAHSLEDRTDRENPNFVYVY
jgi:hypothetical protein